MASTESQEAARLLEEALRDDLERCRASIVAGRKDVALAQLENAFAKLDTALDLVRSDRRA